MVVRCPSVWWIEALPILLKLCAGKSLCQSALPCWYVTLMLSFILRSTLAQFCPNITGYSVLAPAQPRPRIVTQPTIVSTQHLTIVAVLSSKPPFWLHQYWLPVYATQATLPLPSYESNSPVSATQAILFLYIYIYIHIIFMCACFAYFHCRRIDLTPLCLKRSLFCLCLRMMTSWNGNIFCVTGLLCEEFTGDRWIPLTKVSDAELWSFLWSVPEHIVEQTMETPVIWDAIALIMTSP